jgi:hypothetical protein
VASGAGPYLVPLLRFDGRPEWITIINFDYETKPVENRFQVRLRIDLKYHSTALKIRATGVANGGRRE